MSTPAEDTLYAALTDIEDLERLAQIGLPEEAIPTEEMRPVVKWAIDEFYKSGRRQAPTRGLLLQNWGQIIEDCGVELIPENQERDSIEAALGHLKGLHADRQWQVFIKVAATEMATAPLTEKVQVLTEITSGLFEVTSELVDTTHKVEARHGLDTSWISYLGREQQGHKIEGLTFGWGVVDDHMGGVRDGEMCILAAGPKTGKSYALNAWALHEWALGRRVCLYTLENSVEMTYDRILCLATGVSARRYQRGELLVEEKEKVGVFLEEQPNWQETLHVISPTMGARTPEMLVREAFSMGADSLLVDQLTFVEHPNPGRKARHEIVGEIVHDFKALISTGREKIPLVLAHQINREGVKAADKLGHYEMHHVAESAGVERAADWVLGLYQSKNDRESRRAVLQILAARREDIESWEMFWDIEVGATQVLRTVTFDE